MATIHVHRIESLDLPELAPYRTLKRQDNHEQEGIFVAEGEKVVRRLIEFPNSRLISVLMPEPWLENLRPLLERRSEVVQAYVAPKPVLEQLTGYSLYQGLLALATIPRPSSLNDLFEKSPAPRLFVAVDGITNAENLGAIVRNCTALGAQGLLVGETSSNPYLRRAVRSSMGTVFKLPVVQPESLAQALGTLRSRGMHCVAAHPHAGEGMLSTANLSADVCLVLGHEGCGVSKEVLATCDLHLAIPMHAGVDSLNVASAAAIFLYEIQRQRKRT